VHRKNDNIWPLREMSLPSAYDGASHAR